MINRRQLLLVFLFFVHFFGLMAFYPLDNEDVKVINAMFAKTREITSMTYCMKKTERIDGKMHTQESDVKLNLNPFKVYIKPVRLVKKMFLISFQLPSLLTIQTRLCSNRHSTDFSFSLIRLRNLRVNQFK